MDPTLVTVGLAAFGGLTWLAYNHPDDFDRLNTVFKWTISAILVGCLWWNAAMDFALTKIIKIGLEPSIIDKIQAAVRDIQVRGILFIVIMVFAVYMLFLEHFISRLERNRKRKSDQGENDE